MARTRRTVGTTLIEVLVVIVIFLVGILAVVQIFPKGINILVLARSTSVAGALSRDGVELMKAHPDRLPDVFVATLPDGSIDPNRNPANLGPSAGDTLREDGMLLASGVPVGDWMLHSGPNAYRRVIGESRVITAPRQVGVGAGMYGCLVVLSFGPLDFAPGNMAVYGNELNQHIGVPAAEDRRSDDEYYVSNANNGAISVGLPSGPLVLANGNTNAHGRTYLASFSAYVQPGGVGPFVRRDFHNLALPLVAPQAPNSFGNQEPLIVPLSAVLSGYNLGSVDLATLRVSRGFTEITNLADNWESDEPYVVKLLNPQLGVLLFSPYAFGQFVAGPVGHVPMYAKVDYSVYDWRILREEFRFPYHVTPQHQLAVGSIKVGGVDGPDGRKNPVIGILEDPSVPALREYNNIKSDNFVLMDLETGGVYCERDPTVDEYEGTQWIDLNKSTGVVTMLDLDNNPSNGTQSDILLPDGHVQRVTVDSRAVRALYRARNEFAVQVFKAAASYDVSPTPVAMPAGHYYVGGTGAGGGPTRIYFPVADIGQKVTFGVLNYATTGGQIRQLLDQDFVVKTAIGEAAPFIDIKDIDPDASAMNLTAYGYAAKNVKGSSITVRTVWNPETFHLGKNATENMQLLNTWGRGWRKSTNETFLEQGDLTR